MKTLDLTNLTKEELAVFRKGQIQGWESAKCGGKVLNEYEMFSSEFTLFEDGVENGFNAFWATKKFH
jgi:hypothetical protein